MPARTAAARRPGCSPARAAGIASPREGRARGGPDLAKRCRARSCSSAAPRGGASRCPLVYTPDISTAGSPLGCSRITLPDVPSRPSASVSTDSCTRSSSGSTPSTTRVHSGSSTTIGSSPADGVRAGPRAQSQTIPDRRRARPRRQERCRARRRPIPTSPAGLRRPATMSRFPVGRRAAQAHRRRSTPGLARSRAATASA